MKPLLFTALLASSAYGQWISAYYPAQNGIESISQIPWSKVTHVIHFAAAPGVTSGSADGTVSLYYVTTGEASLINSTKPAGKKVLLCIKDNDSSTSAFSQATASGLRSTFISNIVALVNTYGYDGIDIDWEDNIDVTNYEKFLVALRAALPSPKIISLAVINATGVSTVAADEQSIVDQINVECYDMNSEPGGEDCEGTDCSWFNSAILSAGDAWKRTASQLVGVFTAAGVIPAKIGIGIPFFEAEQSVSGPLVNGDYTITVLSYNSMVTNSALWTAANTFYSSTYEAEYLVTSAPLFVSYTGNRGIGNYVAWMKSRGFGGMMTFDLAYEFNASSSGDDQYPLSSTLFSTLFGGSTHGGNAHHGGNSSQ